MTANNLVSRGRPPLWTCRAACIAQGAHLARYLTGKLLGPAALGLAALGLTVALSAEPACAQSFPVRPVRVVVDAPAGAVNDIYARLIARHVSETLGQPVVIDNRPGASGVVAAEEVLRSAPDGYTVLFGGMSSLVTTPAAGGRLRFDVKSAFIPTARANGGFFLIVVSGQHEVQTLSGLADYARKAPAAPTCGTIGNGSTYHFACAQVARALGVQLALVPYKGATTAMQDAAARHIDLVPAYPSEVAPLLEAGKLRALAVLGPERILRVSSVPTMAELGFSGFELQTFSGFYYPAGTPDAVVNAVNRAVVKAMTQPDIVERLKLGGGVTKAMDAQEFARFVSTEQARWKQIAESAGIKAESE